jgi:hypothetical protein
VGEGATLVAMSESPYAISEDELVRTARVPVAEQVEVQAEPRPDATIWQGANPFGDGASGDADCE